MNLVVGAVFNRDLLGREYTQKFVEFEYLDFEIVSNFEFCTSNLW